MVIRNDRVFNLRQGRRYATVCLHFRLQKLLRRALSTPIQCGGNWDQIGPLGPSAGPLEFYVYANDGVYGQPRTTDGPYAEEDSFALRMDGL